jgi:enoyl-[acyl-carrier-protein] reductase (NADH)
MLTDHCCNATWRPADPAEIANAALFLTSDESSCVNGSVLFADGSLS